jgi:uncharacterized protein (TIGR03067 family)
MRAFCTPILLVLLFPVSGFAQPDETQKLRAEVEKLRAENAQLKKQLAGFFEMVRMMNAVAVEEEKFEGVWLIETASENGRDRKHEVGAELEFRGNRVIVRVPGRKDVIYLGVHLSPTSKPCQINFTHLPKQPCDTNTALDLVIGIYELDGDQLRICLQSAYTIPTEFSDKISVQWVLKRKKVKE